MKLIELEIPSDLETEDEIKDFLEENKNDYYGAMDFSDVPDRGNVDNVEIEEIQFDEKGVTIEYRYEWSVYYGCDDMDKADTEDGLVIEGKREGSKFIFEEFVNPEKRSTFEEF